MDAKHNRDKTVRDAKSGLILDAARAVFADKGFHETRLEDIAAASGFSKASLYNYYRDKQEIFLHLAIREHHRILEQIRKSLRPDAPLMENLANATRAVLTAFGEHFAFILATANFQALGSLHAQMAEGSRNDSMAEFHAAVMEVLDLFASLLTKAREQGEITTQIPERVMALHVASIIRGVVMQWKIAGKIGDIEQEVKQITVFVAKGIGA